MARAETARDTRREAAEAQLRTLREMGISGRLAAGLRFSRSMIARSRAALRARHPDADETHLKLLWIEQNYGPDLAAAVADQMKCPAWTSTTTSS